MDNKFDLEDRKRWRNNLVYKTERNIKMFSCHSKIQSIVYTPNLFKIPSTTERWQKKILRKKEY